MHVLCPVLKQDIRRFFAPTSVKPAVQKLAANGNFKEEEKRKKKSQSSDEELRKKETTKARNNVMLWCYSQI